MMSCFCVEEEEEVVEMDNAGADAGRGGGGGGRDNGRGYVVEMMLQSYVFCPFRSRLSGSGSTPDSSGAHFEVVLR